MTVALGSLKFRARDYCAEEAAATLPRLPPDSHPLANFPSSQQNVAEDKEEAAFDDPLRASAGNFEESDQTVKHANESGTSKARSGSPQISSREWASFKRSLMQKFPAPRTINITSVSDILVKSGKASDKSLASVHMDALEDPQISAKDEVRIISKEDYVSQLNELKEEIKRSWRAEDRVASLKLSMKVTRLLADTSVFQFYPMLFVLVTDIMDMLGDLVWDRIKRKAECSDDGNSVCCLPEHFRARDVSIDAKETCYNWFSKIGSIRELLPRMLLIWK